MAAEKRAAEALLGDTLPELPEPEDEARTRRQIEIDASTTMSAEEKLKTLDFEQMSTAEIAEAKRMLARLPCRSNRSSRAAGGGIARGRGSMRGAPSAPRCDRAARCVPSSARSPARAGRTSWCFATFPVR